MAGLVSVVGLGVISCSRARRVVLGCGAHGVGHDFRARGQHPGAEAVSAVSRLLWWAVVRRLALAWAGDWRSRSCTAARRWA